MAPIAQALGHESAVWEPGKATPLMDVATIKRHVKILAWIHIVMGGGLLLVALALLASVFFEGGDYTHTLPFLLGLFSWFAIGLFIPALAGGVGLLRKKRWARVLTIFVSVEFLFVFSGWHRARRIRTLGAAEGGNRTGIRILASANCPH